MISDLVADISQGRDYITLGGQIILASIAALGAAFAAYLQFVVNPKLRTQLAIQQDEARARAELDRKVDLVLKQVQNSHTTNLRDDFDNLRHEVRSGLSNVNDRIDRVVEHLIKP